MTNNKKGLVVSLLVVIVLCFFVIFLCNKRKPFDVENFAFDDFCIKNMLGVYDYKITSIDDDTINISSLIEDEMLVVFVPNINCMACEVRYLDPLIEYSSKLEKENKVIVIGNFSSKRQQIVFGQALGVNTYMPLDNSCFTNTKNITYCVIDSMLNVNVSFDAKEYAEYNDKFLKSIMHRITNDKIINKINSD